MPLIMEVVIAVTPNPDLSKNAVKASHWRNTAKHTRESREIAKWLAFEQTSEWPANAWKLPLEQAEVMVCQYYANTPLDYDGLAMKAAPAIDGIVDAGLIADDSPKCIKKYELRHEKVAHRHENRIEITVREHMPANVPDWLGV